MSPGKSVTPRWRPRPCANQSPERYNVVKEDKPIEPVLK
jgi:hypothetical protein